MDETNLKIINMSDVESKEISWLWYPFIPYGKLTIIQGDPGEGKTTLVLNIAAVLSKGQGLDEHMNPEQPLHIIYQTAEDGLADTVKPRLEKAQADCNNIFVIDETDVSLSMLDERIEQAILKELADLCTGPITDEEFEDCRRGLLSGMNGVEDSLGGIESWYYIEVLRAGANSAALIQSPEQARSALRAVTKDEVRDILRRLTLSVSYLLTKEDTAHAAE